MRFAFRDGDRTRLAEVETLGAARFRVSVDGVALEVEAERRDGNRLTLKTVEGARVAEVTAAGDLRFVRLDALDFVLRLEREGRRGSSRPPAAGLEAPMPGVVTRVLVAPGDTVRKGQPLLALEAMKMEHVIRAPRDGRVRSLAAKAGEMVNGGAPLVEMEDEGQAPSVA